MRAFVVTVALLAGLDAAYQAFNRHGDIVTFLVDFAIVIWAIQVL